jgi:NDP-sugar pyrophosphorylase family protein
MKAMILAAGQGNRLMPLTARRAKPTLPLANRPLLAYTLRLLVEAGIGEAVINLHHWPESVADALGDCCEGVALHYSRESTIRGTAGALLPVASFFPEPFLVVYGDNLLDVDLGSLIAFHAERGALATIGLYHAPDPTAVGIVGADEHGWVTSFREKPSIQELQSTPYAARVAANAGIYVLEPDLLRAIPPTGTSDFGRDIFPALLRNRSPIAAAVLRGYVQDTGTLVGYRRAHADLLGGWLPRVWRPEEERLWEWEPGVFVHETARVACDARLEPPCLIGAGAAVAARACLGPNVCLGPRAVVEEAADLVETIVWASARIGARVLSRHAVIGERCVIGADAELLDVALADGTVVPEGGRRRLEGGGRTVEAAR